MALTRYYAEITYLDEQFGRVLELLGQADPSRDTLIVFLSEQGSNFPFAKWTLYDNGHHGGMLLRWRKRPRQVAESDALIQYADLLPTLLDLAGKHPAHLGLDGRSFRRVLEGETAVHRSHAFAIHTTRGIASGAESYPVRSVTDGRYRLIWNLDHGQAFDNTVVKQGGPYGVLASWAQANPARSRAYVYRPEFELYDMRRDPDELTNVAGQSDLADTQGALKAALSGWMMQQGDLGRQTEADALLRKRVEEGPVPPGIPPGGEELDYDG